MKSKKSIRTFTLIFVCLWLPFDLMNMDLNGKIQQYISKVLTWNIDFTYAYIYSLLALTLAYLFILGDYFGNKMENLKTKDK